MFYIILNFYKYGKIPLYNKDYQKEKQNLVHHLRFLRDDFSSEIPEKILHSTSPDNKYKVRQNWWQGAIADFQMALYFNFIKAKELENEIKQFLKKYATSDFFID